MKKLLILLLIYSSNSFASDFGIRDSVRRSINEENAATNNYIARGNEQTLREAQINYYKPSNLAPPLGNLGFNAYSEPYDYNE